MTVFYKSKSMIFASAALACSTLACLPADEGGDIDPYALMAEVDAAEQAEPNPIVPDEVDDPTPNCSLEARPAAMVRVLASHGATIEQLPDDATVLYRRHTSTDGWGEVREAYCSNPTCSIASLGHGQPGNYLIGAFACGDYALTGVAVQQTPDGCHVETEYVPMVLGDAEPGCFGPDAFESAGESTPGPDPELAVGAEPIADPQTPAEPTELILDDADCPVEFANPSIVASAGVIQGDILWPQTPGRILSRHQSDSSADPMNCLDPECTLFHDEWGLTGEFEVTAEICGRTVQQTVEVEPTLDGCNVETEWVGLMVDAEDCAVDGFAN